MPKAIRKAESNQVFDRDTREEEIAELVDTIKQSPHTRDSLVSLLPERNPLYINRSMNATVRIRGYVLSAFEQIGLPEAAIPYVLEELQSGRNAYVVAAAAKALRGLDPPTPKVIPFLFKAIENIKYLDDSLTFESYRPRWPVAEYTTALKEIFETFGWLGVCAKTALRDLEALYEDRHHDFSAAIRTEIQNAIDRIRADKRPVGSDCCGLPTGFSLGGGRFGFRSRNPRCVNDIELEDQDGASLRYEGFFKQTPSIVVFFYSRCNNPDKCSLTITKLGRLQQAIRKEGLEGQLKTAAITYDPEYDLPPRLKAYGQNRGVVFSDHDRILRTRTGFKELQNYFRLGVSFSGSIVNQHRIELFILDSKGRVVATFARLQWDIQEVLNQAKVLLKAESKSGKTFQRQHIGTREPTFRRTMSTSTLSLLPSLAVAFFPKCPVCWAAYLSVFGMSGFQTMPYSPWLLPVFILLMLINLLSVFKRSNRRSGKEAFYLSALGTAVVLVLGLYFEMRNASYVGIAMIFAASLISSLPSRLFRFRSFPLTHL